MNRQEANLKIAEIIATLPINDIRFDTADERCISLYEAFKELAEVFPQQRAGQIICNYLCSDYRDPDVTDETKAILGTLFPNNPDPFFEESIITLERLWQN